MGKLKPESMVEIALNMGQYAAIFATNPMKYDRYGGFLVPWGVPKMNDLSWKIPIWGQPYFSGNHQMDL